MKTLSILVLFLVLNLPPVEARERDRERDREARQERRQERNRSAARGTVYGTADDGTELKWTVYPASGAGPHPAVLVIHGGGFRKEPNSPKTIQAARDAAAAGFNVFHAEYRLAAPGRLPGQKSAGRYPDQTNDLKIAVRAARVYPGGNGKVGAIGGSAGAAHDVYLAATGTAGDDRLDAAVALSGAYDFNEPGSHEHRGFEMKVKNYVGSSDPAALRKASPITYVDAAVAPLFVIASDREAMPPEQYPNLIQKLESVGATNFQKLLRTDSQAHAFAYWPEVRDRCLAFLKENLGAPSKATSGPTR